MRIVALSAVLRLWTDFVKILTLFCSQTLWDDLLLLMQVLMTLSKNNNTSIVEFGYTCPGGRAGSPNVLRSDRTVEHTVRCDSSKSVFSVEGGVFTKDCWSDWVVRVFWVGRVLMPCEKLILSHTLNTRRRTGAGLSLLTVPWEPDRPSDQQGQLSLRQTIRSTGVMVGRHAQSIATAHSITDHIVAGPIVPYPRVRLENH